MIPEDQKNMTTQWCSTGRLFLNLNSNNMYSSYGTKLVERVEELDDQVCCATVDAGVDDIQELSRLPDNVERLHIVRLLT